MQSVLIKLSGELFSDPAGGLTATTARGLIKQMVELSAERHVGIVIGGGNFFRGGEQGVALGLRPQAAHNVGMHATVLNGLILQELFFQAGSDALVMSPARIYGATQAAEQRLIDKAQQDRVPLIFVGGTGSPFFTTDTAAMVRALQLGAPLVIKATNVDGVFTSDPRKNADAVKIPSISIADAIARNLGVIDQTALVLALEHKIKIRVVDLRATEALHRALRDDSFGSTIY